MLRNQQISNHTSHGWAGSCVLAVIITAMTAGSADLKAQENIISDSWTGFYGAFGGGVAWADIDLDLDLEGLSRKREKLCFPIRRPPPPPPPPYISNTKMPPPPPPPPPVIKYICKPLKPHRPKWFEHSESFNEEITQGFATVQLEYKQEIGNNFVVSAFIDADKYFGGSEQFSVMNSHYKHYYELNGSVDLDYSATIGGTLGFKLNPDTLIYGLVGYTYLKLNNDLNFSTGYSHHGDNKEIHNVGLNMPDDLEGVTLGAGFQTRISNTMSFKIEYRYTDLDDESASGSFSSSHTTEKYLKHGKKLVTEHSLEGSSTANLDADLHSVRAAIVIKLN